MRKFGEQPPFMTQIKVRNLLSFSPDSRELKLENLNILVGPNGSGKSNLIDAIDVLRNSTGDVKRPFIESGGLSEWLHKPASAEVADLSVIFTSTISLVWKVFHCISAFESRRNSITVRDLITGTPRQKKADSVTTFSWDGSTDWYFVWEEDDALIRPAHDDVITQITLDNTLSVLNQRGDPDVYPVLAFLIESYKQIAIYREWHFGKNSIYRSPQRADQRNDRLEEDFSNLALVLNRFKRNVELKKRIIELLHKLNETFDDFDVSVEGGTAQIFFTEGSFTVPATRLSDGTLRFLCLIAILLDPNPPKLICLEEPELGLHPDIIPVIADMLIEASKRTQLIVTTHSDILVDCMSDMPSAIVVCEKNDGQTELRRLTEEEVAPWLEKYRLGELWTKGEIGGNRW